MQCTKHSQKGQAPSVLQSLHLLQWETFASRNLKICSDIKHRNWNKLCPILPQSENFSKVNISQIIWGFFQKFMKNAYYKKGTYGFKHFYTKIHLSYRSIFPQRLWSTLIKIHTFHVEKLENKEFFKKNGSYYSPNSCFPFLRKCFLFFMHTTYTHTTLLCKIVISFL